MDPQNPYNPYPPNDPYEPDDPHCTTEPYSSCTTHCVAGATPSSCASSCSTSFTCAGNNISTIGTQTIAGWGTAEEEPWPTATPDAACTSAVLASVQSQLDAWYPPPPPPTTTATTVPGPLYTDVYTLYSWTCYTLFATTFSDRVGMTAAGRCGSRDIKMDQMGHPYVGSTYTICGGSRELGQLEDLHLPGMGLCHHLEMTDGWCCQPVSYPEAVTCRDEHDVECTVRTSFVWTDKCNG